ncbi:MAG: MoaD/ThiS family protein [Acidobacteriota bacterium]|jgi:molybdopterin synthase sulfur carrier subunit
MGIRVHLYSSLRKYADTRSIVEVNGSTVGECLHDLVKRYPAIAPELFDDSGHFLDKVFVSINLESTYREKLDAPVKEKDDLYLILIVAGG